ncbi:permease [Candidatus Caldatribacterium sp. SIUC1]|uniref:permease n=1 Tax=Candidatus Caldatribacterium sp. SIUC1 TaxID=3418365 RepID=UPI003F6938C5
MVRNILRTPRDFSFFWDCASLRFFFSPLLGRKVFTVALRNILFMLSVVPPVFILTGLFDVWIPREKVVRRLGEASGMVGIGIALALGTLAAGPLYAAFPVAEVLLRKGVSLRNVWIFLGAWSTMKVPMLLFEIQNLGLVFAASRYFMSFLGVLAIAFLLDRFLSLEEKNRIYLPFETPSGLVQWSNATRREREEGWLCPQWRFALVSTGLASTTTPQTFLKVSGP